MQDIISTLKNALQQAEAGLEVAVGRLAKDGTERGDFKPSEVLALACVREALAMPVTCLHQIQEPEADIWPCVNIDVDDSGKITNAKLYSPGLPAGNHDVYPVRVPYMDEHTEAWLACAAELRKHLPDFMHLRDMNGIECAVAAIRELAERSAPAQAAPAAVAVPDAAISGALFDFCGYLTTLPRQQAITASEAHEASPMVEALKQWAAKRNLHLDDADVTGWSAALAATPAAAAPVQRAHIAGALAFFKCAIDCKEFNWDSFQRESAEASLQAALNALSAINECDTPNYCRSVQRCTAMDEQLAAAEPVVLPEPAMNEDGYLPCPFCSSDQVSLSTGEQADGEPWYYVECENCAATSDPEKWNERALPAGVSAPAAPAINLLAADHSGMKVDYRGLFSQVQRAIKRSDPGYAEMLRQLEGHLQELGQRWYAGDTNVVDEILQLYCIERDARKTVRQDAAASPQAQADARDAESDYQRGYRHGYNRRDAEVQGALL